MAADVVHQQTGQEARVSARETAARASDGNWIVADVWERGMGLAEHARPSSGSGSMDRRSHHHRAWSRDGDLCAPEPRVELERHGHTESGSRTDSEWAVWPDSPPHLHRYSGRNVWHGDDSRSPARLDRLRHRASEFLRQGPEG